MDCIWACFYWPPADVPPYENLQDLCNWQRFIWVSLFRSSAGWANWNKLDNMLDSRCRWSLEESIYVLQLWTFLRGWFQILHAASFTWRLSRPPCHLIFERKKKINQNSCTFFFLILAKWDKSNGVFTWDSAKIHRSNCWRWVCKFHASQRES